MASQSKENILVLGAGELGTEIILGLLHHPLTNRTKITAAIRQSSIDSKEHDKVTELTRLRSLGVSLLGCDTAASSVTDLSTIFRPYPTIINCAGMASVPDLQTKICQAVLQTKTVRRYIPWQFGVDYDRIGRGSSQDLFDEQLRVRDALRSQSHTEWNIISVGLFTSFLFHPAFQVVTRLGESEWQVLGLGSWENKLTITTPKDIGKMVAEIIHRLWKPNQVVFIAGETLSFVDVADLVQDQTRGKVTRRLRAIEDVEELLRQNPGDGIAKYHGVWARGIGVAWSVADTLNGKQDIPLQSAKEYLLEHPLVRP